MQLCSSQFGSSLTRRSAMFATMRSIPAPNPIKERRHRIRVLASIAKLRGRVRFQKAIDKTSAHKNPALNRRFVAAMRAQNLFPNDLLLPREPVRSSSSLFHDELFPSTLPHFHKLKTLNNMDTKRQFEGADEAVSKATQSLTSWRFPTASLIDLKKNDVSQSDSSSKALWKLDALAHIFGSENGLASLSSGPTWKSLGKCCSRSCDGRRDDEPTTTPANNSTPSLSTESSTIKKLSTLEYDPTNSTPISAFTMRSPVSMSISPVISEYSTTRSSFVTSDTSDNSDGHRLTILEMMHQMTTDDFESDDPLPVILLPKDSLEFVTPNRKPKTRFQHANDSFTEDIEERILEPLCEADYNPSFEYTFGTGIMNRAYLESPEETNVFGKFEATTGSLDLSQCFAESLTSVHDADVFDPDDVFEDLGLMHQNVETTFEGGMANRADLPSPRPEDFLDGSRSATPSKDSSSWLYRNPNGAEGITSHSELSVASDVFSVPPCDLLNKKESILESPIMITDGHKSLSPNWFRNAIAKRREKAVEETYVEENESCESLTSLLTTLEKTPKPAPNYLLNLEVLKDSPLLTRARQRSSIFKPPRLSGRDSLEWDLDSYPANPDQSSSHDAVGKLTSQIGSLSLQPKRRDSNC